MLNTIALMGRLTADPELKKTPNGISVTSFTLAVDRDYSGKDGADRQVDFINIVAWRGTAEFAAKYFAKGSPMALCGRLQSRNWEDNNGNKRTAVEVVAENIYFAGGKKTEAGGYGNDEFVEVDDDGELPF